MGSYIQYLVGALVMRYFLILLYFIPTLIYATDYLEDEPNVKYGQLKEDQTWEGDIYLVGDVRYLNRGR